MNTFKTTLLLMLLATCAFGQATSTSTTLSSAVLAPSSNSQGTTQWCLASATGVVLPSLAGGTLGSYLATGAEIAQVVSQGTTSTCFNVKRGQLGTTGNYAWASGAIVWVGTSAVSSGDPSRPYSPGVFIDTTPVGTCTAANQYTLPLVASGGKTGRGIPQLVTCSSGSWISWDLGTGHSFSGTCVLGTSCAVTFPLAFSSSTSYACSATDITAIDATKAAHTSAAVVTITGNSTDSIDYICTGT